MRAIKFRAWHEGMGQWVYFTPEDLLHGYVFSRDRSEHWLIRGTDMEQLGDELQYTGLLDKNGNSIYEGDIIEVCDRPDTWIGQVVFYEGGFFVESFYLAPDGVTCRTDKRWFLKGQLVDVIGNICENPGLLEKAA